MWSIRTFSAGCQAVARNAAYGILPLLYKAIGECFACPSTSTTLDLPSRQKSGISIFIGCR